MAKPQTEDGYFKIENEIAELFARANFNKYEWRIIFCTLRATWGWRKKDTPISINEYSILTGISKRNVIRTVQGLLKKNVLFRIGPKERIFNYGFQKDYEKWEGVFSDSVYSDTVNKDTVGSDTIIVSDKTPKTVSKKTDPLHLSKNNKNNLKTKDKILISDEQIKEARRCFKEDNCGNNWKNRKSEKCLYCIQELKGKYQELKFVKAEREKENWERFKEKLNL